MNFSLRRKSPAPILASHGEGYHGERYRGPIFSSRIENEDTMEHYFTTSSGNIPDVRVQTDFAATSRATSRLRLSSTRFTQTADLPTQVAPIVISQPHAVRFPQKLLRRDIYANGLHHFRRNLAREREKGLRRHPQDLA